MLPDRSIEAEDRFVVAFVDDDDPDRLVDAISSALEARRPRLAARLVALLADAVEVDPGSPVARARQAAGLILARAEPDDADTRDLEEAWSLARRLRMRRVVRRHRWALEDREDRPGPFGRRRRR